MTTETTMSLLPRTFFIQLRRPYGQNVSTVYHLYIHADSRQVALEWTQRLFPGMNFAPMLQRWANPCKCIGVGNSDPTIITDCDDYRNGKARGAHGPRLETHEGANRRTTAQVRESLERVLDKLRQDHKDLRDGFFGMLKDYEKFPSEHRYGRLADVKKSAENAKVWLTNLELDMHMLPEDAPMEMPAARHVNFLAAAA